jgi:small subunit ribosomal protein S3
MGHKVNPTGFRLGVIRSWQAKWYADDKHYPEFLQEDLKLRRAIKEKYADAAVSLVEIERQANQVSVTIYTARPGIVIGRGGQRVDETRRHLERLLGKRVQLNIKEVQRPELDAYLVGRTIAEQIERRIAYRRAMKQALARTMQAGAKGMKVTCAGRLGGAEIARRLSMHEGQVPLHTLRADIDYGFIEAHTIMGRIGIKVWVYKGEILPETKVEEVEEAPAEAVSVVPTEAVLAGELAKPPVTAPPAEAEAVEVKVEAPVTAEVEVKAEAPVATEPEKKARPKRAAKIVTQPEVTTEAPTETRVEAPVATEPEKKARPKRAAKIVTQPEVTTEVSGEAKMEAPPVAEPEKKTKPAARRKAKVSPPSEETPEAQAQ